MELQLSRVDYTVAGVTNKNCMRLLPPSTSKEPQKVIKISFIVFTRHGKHRAEQRVSVGAGRWVGELAHCFIVPTHQLEKMMILTE